MANAAHLILLDCERAPITIPVMSSETEVGSSSSARAHLLDPDVIPIHATIERTALGFMIKGHAPLRVNGRRTNSQPLQHGDLVTLGRSALQFRLGDAVEHGGATSAEDPAQALHILRSLYELTRRLYSGDSIEQLTDELLADVVGLTGAHRGMLVLFGDSDTVKTQAAKTTQGQFDPTEDRLSQTALAKIRDTRSPQLWMDIDADVDLAHAPSIHGARVRSLMAAPILVGDELIGALYLSKSESHDLFDQQALDLLAIYANQTALLLGSVNRGRALSDEVAEARRELKTVRDQALIGSSDAMQHVIRNVRKVAQSNLATLIVGETGTGKEIIAREVHRLSDRATGPFVPVNCGAIPADLLESELFGHVRGAFTGATTERAGRIRSAAGGTLFLDEIGEMPLEQQAKLLRVLEDHTVVPVGGDRPYAVDFRLVCATNAKLAQDVQQQRFREDLYYRIAGFIIDLPPVRERGDDALELAQFFLKRQAVLLERPPARLSAAAMTAIRGNAWPGNVRELQAAVRRALVVCEDHLINPTDLGMDGDVSDEPEFVPLAEARDTYLKEYVRRAVAHCDDNRTAAARMLGVTPRTIFKYLEEV